MTEDEDEQQARKWDKKKSAKMVSILGKEHNMVMHSVIPYALGGALDLYYFPNGIAGTAVATKECSEFPGEGSSNAVFDAYELVMFTKHAISLNDAQNEETAFGKAHTNFNAILNRIAPYSQQATLNPGETCEFPEDLESVGGKCLIFDSYGLKTKRRVPFGLLAVIQIFRSEMNYARQRGGHRLLAKLQDSGVYPYSDLERNPVA